jgi:hypothetical protein
MIYYVDQHRLYTFNARLNITNTRLYTTNARWLRTRATAATVKSHHMPFFDAERFARLLEKEGFSAAQARTVIQALDDVVDERYN